MGFMGERGGTPTWTMLTKFACHPVYSMLWELPIVWKGGVIGLFEL